MDVKTITKEEFENGLYKTENHFIIDNLFYLNVNIQDYGVICRTSGDVEELLESIELYTKHLYFILDYTTNTDDIKTFWAEYEYLFTGDLENDLYNAYDECTKALNTYRAL
jgi:hypothetical protein